MMSHWQVMGHWQVMMGRSLHVPHMCSDVAYFTFAALCDTAVRIPTTYTLRSGFPRLSAGCSSDAVCCAGWVRPPTSD